LKGKVNSYKESYYSVRDNFGKIKPGSKLNDSVFHDQSVSFDQKGNISEVVEYNPDGTIFCKFKGSNDYADNQIESIYVRFDPEITIDRKPFLLESARYSSGEMCDMSYRNDTLGRPVEEIIYDLMGREIYKISFIRDTKGEMMRYEFSNGTVEHYKYDNKGNRKELISQHLNSKPTITSFNYDESGNLIEMKIDNYFKSTFKFSYDDRAYKYLFDSQGNWKERIEYENGRPMRMVVRTIDYSL